MTLLPVKVLIFAAGCYFAYNCVIGFQWIRYVERVRDNLRRYPRLNKDVDEDIRRMEESTGVPSFYYPMILWAAAVVATLLITIAWVLPAKLGNL